MLSSSANDEERTCDGLFFSWQGLGGDDGDLLGGVGGDTPKNMPAEEKIPNTAHLRATHRNPSKQRDMICWKPSAVRCWANFEL